MVLEVGTIAIKTAGREASRYCVVVKKIDENFVLVTGPKALTGVKRRRCNVLHLEATPYKLEIKEDANDKDVLKAWKESKLYKKLGLKLPPVYKVEGKEEKKESKKTAKKTAKKTTKKKTAKKK